MSTLLPLLPQPRHLQFSSESLTLRDRRLIVLDCAKPPTLLFAALRFQAALQRQFDLLWEITASPMGPAVNTGLIVRVAPDQIKQPQGYALTIGSGPIVVEAHDTAGAFYGLSTLIQILCHPIVPFTLPGLRITDWPDFPVRGVMLDISRDKVPTLETTLALIDRLASWKINQFQLYTEHTFAYRQHPDVWAKASPFTGEEILQLDAYCRERFVELVPNQNSFGHMQRWLKHPRYAHLAEAPNGFDFPWGAHSDSPFGLCPLDPGSLELVTGLYDELLPHFTSRHLNVGCDETFDLGQGRSKDECERRGSGRVYLEFLQSIYREVTKRRRVMQFWGDIVVQHPDLIPELPTDAVALEWGYEADHPFDAHGAQFAQAGLQFYVCPGTSSWTSIAGRTDNALGNLRSAAENGLKHGAAGYLNTDWGDEGHWQTLPVSYLGFVMGAAYAWAYEANRETDVPRVVSGYAFDDPSGNFGRAAYDLGNVYRLVGVEPPNSSALFWMLQWPLSQVENYRDTVSPETLRETLVAIDRAVSPLNEAHSTRSDAGLLQREFDLAARMLRHACRRGLWALGAPDRSARDLEIDLGDIIAEYESVWLARNRPGGLTDSVARLIAARADYAAV